MYSGCSTCRARKIKCDERQPKCYNCERSRRYICDGYDQTVDVLPTVARRARVTPSVPRTATGSSNPDAERSIDEAAEIERIFHDFDTTGIGPMSPPVDGVSNQYSRSFLGWPSPFTAQLSPGVATANTDGFDHISGRRIDFQNDFDLIGDFLPWIAQQAPSPPTFEARLTHQSGLENALRSGMSPPVMAQADVTTLHALQKSQPSPLMRELRPDPLEMSDTMRKLLHHYQTHVCQLMMPTSAPSHNPWLHLYLPIALQEPPTAPKRCLLHAILSVAAFNKAELSSIDKRLFRREGSEHMEKAWHLLNKCTSNEPPDDVGTITEDPTDRQALLAAALTMTTVEVFSGAETGKGYEHLLLCKRIIKLTGGLTWWLSDTANVTLLQIFRCLEIVGYTSGWAFRKDNVAGDVDENVAGGGSRRAVQAPEVEAMTTALALAPQYTLDVSFGVSMKTLRCLNKIIELANIKASLSPGNVWLPRTMDEIVKLETELFDILDDSDAFSGQQDGDSGIQKGISNYVSEEIKENHVWAFHYSTAIFFRRALCDGDATIKSLACNMTEEVAEKWASRPSGQALVSKALEHLENVDALSSDIAIANTLWPGFIAAVEAVDMPLRHRALIWFARAKRHGIGNIAKAKDLVMEVWRRVDRQTWVSPERKNLQSELSHVDWREVMREKGMYIMLT